jgi:hypothetical protein
VKNACALLSAYPLLPNRAERRYDPAEQKGSSRMRSIGYLTFAIVAVVTFTAGPASANICRAERLTCVTTMPVGGYCECTARGTIEGGEVVAKPEPGIQ